MHSGSFNNQGQYQLPLESRITQDVVAEVASDKWREFGRSFGYTRPRTSDIVSADPNARDSEKLRMLIDEWQRQRGHEATLKELLKACDNRAVNVMAAVVDELLKLERFQSSVGSLQSTKSRESDESFVQLCKHTSRSPERSHLRSVQESGCESPEGDQRVGGEVQGHELVLSEIPNVPQSATPSQPQCEEKEECEVPSVMLLERAKSVDTTN